VGKRLAHSQSQTGRKKNGRTVRLTQAWILFYGRTLGMSKQEIMVTDYAEMVDMITCLSIYNGIQQPETTRKIYDFDAAMMVE
jgi:hypothetical protein